MTLLRHAAVALALLSACTAPREERDWRTRSEASGFRETTRYDEAVALLRAFDAASDEIHLTTYGYSYEGRPLPLAVVGASAATPEAVRATGKTRIFVQANIHAGEVEGKEAALGLLRSVALGERGGWLDEVVLLVAPIYNADGNERVRLDQRGAQHGPLGGTGQRHNAQDLDLNRDCVKLETPEARSMALLMDAYDPHVALDLHTTNGSAHGYPLTYDIAGGPNVNGALTALLRDELLPAVTRAIRAEDGREIFWYGGPTRGENPVWENDGDLYRPRYTHTYFGLRNALGILSEAYSYAPFEERIHFTYRFVEETIDWVVAHGERVRALKAAADAEPLVGRELALSCTLAPTAQAVEILLADLVEERNPYVPDRPLRRLVPGRERRVTMPHHGTLVARETARVPRAYVLPAPETPPEKRQRAVVLDRLAAHGIRHALTGTSQSFAGERFRLTANTASAEAYQGAHHARTLEGAWEAHAQELAPGTLVVPLDQPLARLVFLFLEPRSDDGFATWNLFDATLAAEPAPEFFPVLRTFEVPPGS